MAKPPGATMDAMDRRASRGTKAIPVGLAALATTVAACGAVSLGYAFAFAFGVPGVVAVVLMCLGAAAAATVVIMRRRAGTPSGEQRSAILDRMAREGEEDGLYQATDGPPRQTR